MNVLTRAIAAIGDLLPTSIRRENEVDTYTAGLFGLCLIVLVLGLVIVLVAPLQRLTVSTAISTGVVALLSALMCFSGGALLGLLFGIPRYSKLDDVENAVAPNNNLEQISDWLTKMIVGITLVQFNEIVQKVKLVALQINDAMLGCAPHCSGNYAMGLAIIGFFSTAGFLMMYLWSRIYLLLDVDRVQRKIDQDAVNFKKLVETGHVQESTPNRERLEEKAGATVAALEVEGEIKPGPDSNDPWKGVFGGRSRDPEKGREVTAVVKSMPGSEYCSVQMTVRSIDSAKPLAGKVEFFLHDTFPEPIQTVPVKDGIATLEIAAWGAFTVGVLADGGATKLEIDLSANAQAPAAWRNR